MFSPPKSAPLPRKQYTSEQQYTKHESLQTELYRGVRGLATLKRTKTSTVKGIKSSSSSSSAKYQFIKKRPLYPEFTNQRSGAEIPSKETRLGTILEV